MRAQIAAVLIVVFISVTAFAQPTRSQVVEKDILLDPNSSFTALTPARLWTNNTVPYVIDSEIPTQTRITDGINYYNQNTPVKFQARVAEANYVHFVRTTVGNGVCMSNVGMIGGEQFIRVEDGCTTASLIHEMGHTLGFFHEQSRSDRNQYVTVLYENLDKNGYSDYPLNGPAIAQIVGPYDYASHMHYPSFSFSVNTLPTMQTVPAGIPLDPYAVMSPGDLDTLFRMYGQPPTKTTIVSDPPGLQLILDGQTLTSPQTLNWDPGSSHTIGVATQNSGAQRFLFGRWSDNGAATHTVVADPAVTFYSAYFISQVPLNVGVSSAGGGTVSLDVSSPDGYFASQTVFNMTATPAPGWTFLHWSGGTSCPRANAASPTRFVTGSTAINCVATFTQAPVTTIVTNPVDLPVVVDGNSYVETPVNFAWAPGSSHTISTAAPASNSVSAKRYVFQNWSDGGAASHTVTAGAAATTITASYTTQYSLVPPVVDATAGTFTITPASSDTFYTAGTQVQVTAISTPGYSFYQWTRDLVGQPNPAILTMDSQKAFGATFYKNPPQLALLSAASFSGTTVSPGEIITIFGNGIGPATPAYGQLDANGKLGTSAGGASVVVNGTAAPIVYASATQTSVVIPYAVAGQVEASVSARYNGNTAVVTMPVDVSAPGLFTSNSRGAGQLAAANQDGSLNSASNPARRGSVVTFYATGAGQLSPAGVDGAITGVPEPQLTVPVSLRIGGKPAELQYAGPAPAQVSGVVQVNAYVPADAPSGSNVSVYLVIGNNSSPAGASIAVQ